MVEDVDNLVKIVKMEKDIDYIKKEQKQLIVLIKDTHKGLDEKFDKLIESFTERLDDFEKENSSKFASKYVEKGFWWIIATVGAAVTAALMGLILK